jgi:flagellar biogenesis protein FliO
VVIAETESVYFEVRTGAMEKRLRFVLKGLLLILIIIILLLYVTVIRRLESCVVGWSDV